MNSNFISVLVAATVVFNMQKVSGAPVSPTVFTLFPHKDFQGSPLPVKLVGDQCYNLDGANQNDYFTSIDIPAGSCLKVFVDSGCRGTCKIITRPFGDLNSLEINDRVTSFRECRENETPCP